VETAIAAPPMPYGHVPQRSWVQSGRSSSHHVRLAMRWKARSADICDEHATAL